MSFHIQHTCFQVDLIWVFLNSFQNKMIFYMNGVRIYPTNRMKVNQYSQYESEHVITVRFPRHIILLIQ